MEGEDWIVDGLRIDNLSWGEPSIAKSGDLTAQMRTGIVLLTGLVEVGGTNGS